MSTPTAAPAGSQLAGIFAAESYAQFMEQGAASVHWLELHNSGYLAGIDATNDPFTMVNDTPRWGYHGARIAHFLAGGNDTMVQATVSGTFGTQLKAHASLHTDGAVSVMMTNTNSNVAAKVTMNVSGGAGTALDCVGARYAYLPVNGDQDGELDLRADLREQLTACPSRSPSRSSRRSWSCSPNAPDQARAPLPPSPPAAAAAKKGQSRRIRRRKPALPGTKVWAFFAMRTASTPYPDRGRCRAAGAARGGRLRARGRGLPPTAVVEGAAEIVTPIAAVLRRRGVGPGRPIAGASCGRRWRRGRTSTPTPCTSKTATAGSATGRSPTPAPRRA